MDGEYVNMVQTDGHEYNNVPSSIRQDEYSEPTDRHIYSEPKAVYQNLHVTAGRDRNAGNTEENAKASTSKKCGTTRCILIFVLGIIILMGAVAGVSAFLTIVERYLVILRIQVIDYFCKRV